MLTAFIILTASLLADLDFSPVRPGAVYDRANPALPPAPVRTENCFGRRSGNALLHNLHREFPRYALGRDGKLSAIKFGNTNSADDALLLPESAIIPPGGIHTQIFWFYVYPRENAGGSCRLMESGFGYGFGFRLEWLLSRKWAASGLLSLTFGTAQGSGVIRDLQTRSCLPGVWHQAAIVNDGEQFALYLDGALVGTAAGKYIFPPGGKTLRVRMATAAANFTFKTDCYQLYSRVWTAEEIAASWQKGQPAALAPNAEENALAALPRLQPQKFGLYAVGENITVWKNGRPAADVVYHEPGAREFIFDGTIFPLMIYAASPAGRKKPFFGAVDLLTRQPEWQVLGIDRSLISIYWWALEEHIGDYDFAALDHQVETARERDIKMSFIFTGEPAWAKKDAAARDRHLQKILAVLRARYPDVPLLEQKDVLLIDTHNPARMLNALRDAEKSGTQNVFLRPADMRWHGVHSPAFSGYPQPAMRAVAEFLAQ